MNYGRLDIDDDDALAVGTFDKISEANINLVWEYKNMEYMLEVAYGKHENPDGKEADNVRIQAAIKYRF